MMKQMENEELSDLKTIYDELWQDARTMVKDMNSSITIVFLFGLTMFAIAPMNLGTVVEMYARITEGSTRWLDYFYLIGTSFGLVISIVAGVAMIRWYNKLKKRYSKLIELEKTLEE
ncbi:hypothetical protein ACFL0D_06625 [Thermoproteota archaeon]